MKKLILVAGILLTVVFGFSLCAMANEYSLPQSAVPPTVDGVMGENEWLGAYHVFINNTKENCVYTSMEFEMEGTATFDVYVTWFYDGSPERSGLYFFFDVKDTSLPYATYTSAEILNWGLSPWYLHDDKIFIGIDPYYAHTEGNAGCLLFTLMPFTDTGVPVVLDQNYLKLAKEPDVRFAVKSDYKEDKEKHTSTYTGYTYEFFVSFEALGVKGEVVPHDIGDMFGLGIGVFDSSRASIVYRATDFGTPDTDLFTSAFSSRYYNTVILSDIEVYPDNYVEVDRRAYSALLKQANTLLNQSSEYTEASVDALRDVIFETSNYIYNVEQPVLDGYTVKLGEALGKLVKRGYAETQSLLAAVAGMKSSDYTSESWAALQTAVGNARKVTNDNDKATIMQAYNALAEANEYLVSASNGEHIVDSSVLDDLIGDFETLSTLKEKYTEETWTVYEDAVNAAKQLTKKNNVQSDYDQAVEAINAGRDGLGRIPPLLNAVDDADEGMDVVLLIYIIVVALVVAVIALVVVIKAIKKKKAAKAE